jgi:hypothetical protein
LKTNGGKMRHGSHASAHLFKLSSHVNDPVTKAQ